MDSLNMMCQYSYIDRMGYYSVGNIQKYIVKLHIKFMCFIGHGFYTKSRLHSTACKSDVPHISLLLTHGLIKLGLRIKISIVNDRFLENLITSTQYILFASICWFSICVPADQNTRNDNSMYYTFIYTAVLLYYGERSEPFVVQYFVSAHTCRS